MDIISAVQAAVTAHNATRVTIVGHSLGTFDIFGIEFVKKKFSMIDLFDFAL